MEKAQPARLPVSSTAPNRKARTAIMSFHGAGRCTANLKWRSAVRPQFLTKKVA